MANIQSFYNLDEDKTSLEKNFFVFHSFATSVLDLLTEHTQINPDAIDQENRLLAAVYYMTYNRLLEDLPVGQIKADFASEMLIDRCL